MPTVSDSARAPELQRERGRGGLAVPEVQPISKPKRNRAVPEAIQSLIDAAVLTCCLNMFPSSPRPAGGLDFMALDASEEARGNPFHFYHHHPRCCSSPIGVYPPVSRTLVYLLPPPLLFLDSLPPP